MMRKLPAIAMISLTAFLFLSTVPAIALAASTPATAPAVCCKLHGKWTDSYGFQW